MKKLLLKCLLITKKLIDKLYYSYYTADKEALIREMFPWINYIWDYSHIDLFLKTTSYDSLDSIVKVITTFYWGEVWRLTIENKFQQIERYQGLLEFCVSIRDYQQYLLLEQNKKDIL